MAQVPISQPQLWKKYCQTKLGNYGRHPLRVSKSWRAMRIQCGETEQKDSAKKVLRKAQKNLKKSLRRISRELGEDGVAVEELVDSDSLDPMWADMYATQKALYEREMSRWDEERRMWDQREQGLLEELKRLQDHVSELFLGGYGNASPDRNPLVTEPKIPASTPESSLAAVKATDADVETQEKVPDFFDGGKIQHEAPVSSVAASMRAAFAAVDQADVLSTEFMHTQQELENNIGASTLPPSNSGQPVVDGQSSSQSEATPIETVKSPPTGPPPELCPGDDDIFWMTKLHQSLEKRGYYAGDMDCEDFFFAEGTTDALLAFQASEGLAETGIADEETWAALLGSVEGNKEDLDSTPGGLVVDANSGVGSKQINLSEEIKSDSPEGGEGQVLQQNSVVSASPKKSSGMGMGIDPELPKTKNGWPALQENDGGKEVHQLHCCLSKHGYFCGDDDMQWWQYGQGTINALKTFQACNGLPQSGSCTEKTWLALLGEGAQPSDLEEMKTGESYDNDRAAQGDNAGGVWLLGEQRWEKSKSD